MLSMSLQNARARIAQPGAVPPAETRRRRAHRAQNLSANFSASAPFRGR
jgi:hypothetical protein